MFKFLFNCATVIFISLSSLIYADCSCFPACCQSFEVGLGWRRDFLHWKVNDLGDHQSYVDAVADSHIKYENLDMYTAYSKVRWASEAYYIRLLADYGTSIKGRAKEHFEISSPLLEGTVDVGTNNRIKRRSEFYDFSGAVGYPFVFCCNRFNVIPLVGFSYHRQRIRVKDEKHSSSVSFIVDSCNPFGFTSTSDSSCSSSGSSDDFISNPFSAPSDPVIHSALGLSAKHTTSVYRFTWYGFYAGIDLLYALDPCWTIFTELEWHFSDTCNRKRKSTTGVYFVDRYHHKGWAHGFEGVVGTVWKLGNCYYATATVDYKYWMSKSHHDWLRWRAANIQVALGIEY